MWKPGRGWVTAELLSAAVLLGLLPFVDGLGRVLLLPAAALAAAFGLRDLLLTPVLEADTEGLTVQDGVRRVGARWDEVQRLRVVRDRRTPLLEVDLGDRVVVLSRRRLGAPVDEVLAELQGLQALR